MSIEEQRTGEIKKIYKRETKEVKDQKKDDKEVKDQKKDDKVVKEQVNTTKGSVGKEQASMVKGLIGKDIIIYIRGGKELKGKLEAVAQYEFVVTISQSPVIVMKHAVDYIIPVGEK